MRQELLEVIQTWLGDWTKSDFGFRIQRLRTSQYNHIEEILYLNKYDRWYFIVFDNGILELYEDNWLVGVARNEEHIEDLCKMYYSYITSNKRFFTTFISS